jgi:hypothetical protein
MKSPAQEVKIRFNDEFLPLQNSATKIFALIDIEKMKFIEMQQANQGYDFYWCSKKDNIEYQLRGDSWYPEKPQSIISVELIGGKGTFARATELVSLATTAGWHAELIVKGTNYGKI